MGEYKLFSTRDFNRFMSILIVLGIMLGALDFSGFSQLIFEVSSLIDVIAMIVLFFGTIVLGIVKALLLGVTAFIIISAYYERKEKR